MTSDETQPLPDSRASPDTDGRPVAILALLVTATIWGTTAIGTKVALDTYPPFILSVGRWLISLGILLPLMIRFRIRPILDRRTAVLGLFGILGFNMFYTFGLERTTAANGSLINGALPVVVAAISFVALKERLAALNLVGITTSLVGVAVTIVGATLDASILGNVLIFGAVLSWAIYTIYNRQKMRGEDTMAIIAGAALVGLLLMLPLAAVEWVREIPPAPDLRLTAIIVYLSLGPALAANYLWIFALSGLILDEPITRFHVIGSVLVILGVVLTTWRRRPESGQSAASMKSIATKPVSPATETSIQR